MKNNNIRTLWVIRDNKTDKYIGTSSQKHRVRVDFKQAAIFVSHASASIVVKQLHQKGVTGIEPVTVLALRPTQEVLDMLFRVSPDKPPKPKTLVKVFEEQEKKDMETIKGLTLEDAYKLWRHTPSGHRFFKEPLWETFRKHVESLGGFTDELAKAEGGHDPGPDWINRF